LKGLDSGFRRNDRKAYLQTFYEIINLSPKKFFNKVFTQSASTQLSNE